MLRTPTSIPAPTPPSPPCTPAPAPAPSCLSSGLTRATVLLTRGRTPPRVGVCRRLSPSTAAAAGVMLELSRTCMPSGPMM
eukprot:751374-Hanusia_phi.AAC.2